MISTKKLLETVRRQKNRQPPLGIRRQKTNEIMKFLDDQRVLILAGIRRSGKSTILAQLMNEIKDYAYVNFEDEIFLEFKASDFKELDDILIEVYGNVQTYFFDEIQVIDKFEIFVRRLQDDGKKVILTGSNASLLSKEFATKLTGRYKTFEIFPFSFDEFLRFNKVSDKNKGSQIKLFEDYLKKGGMPEYLKNNDSEYIKDVYNSIIYKDIITRYDIKKEKIMRELVLYLVSNLAKQITYNSLRKLIGLSNAITIKEYIQYLGNSYLFFEIPKFDYSIKKQILAPKKIYLIDSAFYGVLGTGFSQNYGFILENLVCIELLRRRKEIFYFQKKGECDFVVRENNKINNVIQVTKELDIGNKDREISGLMEAMDEFDLTEGLILTQNFEDKILMGKKIIYVKPVWKWLLENS